MAFTISFPKVLTWAPGQAQWARLVESTLQRINRQFDNLSQAVDQLTKAVNAVTKLGSTATIYVGGLPAYSISSDGTTLTITRINADGDGNDVPIAQYLPPESTGLYEDWVFNAGGNYVDSIGVSIADLYFRLSDLDGL